MHLVDLTIFYAPQSGGVKTYIKAKADWIAKQTHIRHTIIAPRWNNDASFVGVPGVRIPFTNGHQLPISVAASTRILRRLQPDCVEVGDPYQFAWAAAKLRRTAEVPIVAYYHSDLPHLIGRRMGVIAERAATRYVKRLYENFDLVLAPSRYVARRLNDIGIGNVRYQPLGVDAQTFSASRRDSNLRSRLGLPEEARLMVYAGRFSREKNLPMLIEAVERLGDPYHLLLIGGGCKLTLSPRVLRLPFQQDAGALAALIASCDVLVHPGDQETFGLIVLEAMACGIPVLGMAAGGVAELVGDDTGMLVRERSVGALMEGIHHIYESDMAALGRNALEKVRQHYDWSRIMPQFMMHYSGLCSVVRGQARQAEQNPFKAPSWR